MFEKKPESQKDKTEILNENKKFQEIHDRFEQKVKYAAVIGLVGPPPTVANKCVDIVTTVL
jgi:hypothetical protein